MNDYKNDVEIIDVTEDSSSYGKGGDFSHQQLVMRCMTKCLEAGSKEMLVGYFNQKMDRGGNLIRVYVEDTRRVFIESVKIAIEIMKCDLDPEATKNINTVIKKLDDNYTKLCEAELKDFVNAHPMIKKQRALNGITNRENSLNKDLPYYQDYINLEVDAYREILGLLTLLTQRKDFFEEEMYTA